MKKCNPVLLSLKNKQGQSQAAQATPLQAQKNGKTQKLGKGQEQKTAEKLGVKKPAQRRSRVNRIG